MRGEFDHGLNRGSPRPRPWARQAPAVAPHLAVRGLLVVNEHGRPVPKLGKEAETVSRPRAAPALGFVLFDLPRCQALGFSFRDLERGRLPINRAERFATIRVPAAVERSAELARLTLFPPLGLTCSALR